MRDILPELNNKDYIISLNENYDIHFCKKEEVEELVLFIDKYWRKNHIFVLSRKLLDWQHYDEDNARYNFVIAKNKNNGEIHSILGFVPTYQFDKNIKNVEVWPCIWKSRTDVKVKGLGVALYYYMKSQINIETISILGISEVALSIYKHWNFETGKIEHYYLPNFKETEVLSENRQPSKIHMQNVQDWTLREIFENDFSSIEETNSLFADRYKSKTFYINRYLAHPIYKYMMLAVKHKEEISSILVTRECKAENKKCLRIVDYVGCVNDLCNVTKNMHDIMEQKNYEYIDFIVVGVQHEALEQAGFVNKKENVSTIIPNYFEPFLKENVDLDYAFKTVNDEIKPLFFKADADQDRPNRL